MKRRELIRELVAAGCYLKRRGKRREIKQSLCDLIRKQLGIELV